MYERDAAGPALAGPAPSRAQVTDYILDMLLDLTGLAFSAGEPQLGSDIAEVIERRMLAERQAQGADPGPALRAGSLP